MAEQEQEEQFIDADEYTSTPDAAITYEQIVLNQIKKCIEEGSKEMSGGYYKERATTKGTMDVYVGDQKEIFINSIISLRRLLLFHYDDKMQDKDKEHDKRLEEITKNVNRMLTNRLQYLDNQKQKGDIQMQIETGYLNPDLYEARWSSDERLKSFGLLLEELIKLYSRKRYLMAQDIDDAAELERYERNS